MGSVISVILGGVHWVRLPGEDLHVYFLDVGQGDSTLLVTPWQQQSLIDGGPGVKVLEEIGEVLPFLHKTFDLVVLTHPHADHVEGLVEILKRYEVRRLVVTGVNSYNAHYRELLRLAREKGVPVDLAQAEQDYWFGSGEEDSVGLFLDVLYPFENLMGKEVENMNNSSIVMRVVYGDSAILLTGDAEKEVEEELLAAGSVVAADSELVGLESAVDSILAAEIFKAGHHGSRTANTPEFMEAVEPEYGVIQCGVDNKFEHPHEETLATFAEQGVTVLRNDLNGRVEFRLGVDGEVEVETDG